MLGIAIIVGIMCASFLAATCVEGKCARELQKDIDKINERIKKDHEKMNEKD